MGRSGGLRRYFLERLMEERKVTRTQRIRTAAAIRVETIVIDRSVLPAYLKIAAQAKRLRELGMSDRAIARALGVSDKTIAKALCGSSEIRSAAGTEQTGSKPQV